MTGPAGDAPPDTVDPPDLPLEAPPAPATPRRRDGAANDRPDVSEDDEGDRPGGGYVPL